MAYKNAHDVLRECKLAIERDIKDIEEKERLMELIGLKISYNLAFYELIKEEKCKTCMWEKKSIICNACDGRHYQDKI